MFDRIAVRRRKDEDWNGSKRVQSFRDSDHGTDAGRIDMLGLSFLERMDRDKALHRRDRKGCPEKKRENRDHRDHFTPMA